MPRYLDCKKCGGARTLLPCGRWTCAQCKRAYDQRRREADPEYNRGRCLEYAASHRDEAAAKTRAWYAANQERAAERNRANYLTNGVEIRRKNREYYRKNPEPFLARARNSTWRRDNPEAAQAKDLRRKARIRDAVCEHGPLCVSGAFLEVIYSSPCHYCGAPSEHADHFYPTARGGLHCRENIVPACVPCNTSKWAHDPHKWLASRVV